jgi:hypothetical protein
MRGKTVSISARDWLFFFHDFLRYYQGKSRISSNIYISITLNPLIRLFLMSFCGSNHNRKHVRNMTPTPTPCTWQAHHRVLRQGQTCLHIERVISSLHQPLYHLQLLQRLCHLPALRVPVVTSVSLHASYAKQTSSWE